MNFRTFLLLIRQSWLDAFAYRSEIYMQLVAWFINFLVYVYLWKAIFSYNEAFGAYSLTSIMTYFFIVQVMRNLIFSHYGFIINQDIRNGDMVNLLVKPTSILPHYFALELGNNVVKFLLGMISNALILFIFWNLFDFSTLTAGSISLGMLSAFPAHFINYCIVSMIGSLAFWITDANRLIFFYFATVTFASGWLLPIDLFPPLLYKIIMATPFPYTFYFPIKLAQGVLEKQEIIYGFAMQASYVLILGTLLHLEIKRGVKRFEGVGR